MFEQTFVEGVGKTNKSWTILLSFAIQLTVVLAVLVIIPLIYFDQIKSAQMSSFLVAPPPPPPPPPPPAAQAVKAVKVIKVFNQLVAPKTIPKEVKMIKEEEVAPPSRRRPRWCPWRRSRWNQRWRTRWHPGWNSFCRCRRRLRRLRRLLRSRSQPVIHSRGRKRSAAANILRQVKPPYPPLARQARIQGTGEVQCRDRQRWPHPESAVSLRPPSFGCRGDSSGGAMGL